MELLPGGRDRDRRGVDFDGTGGTLTFGPGITSRQIVVPIVGDKLNEPAETFDGHAVVADGGAVLGTPPRPR